jgi:DNA-directed RNA polymerase specialized sigma24 family protein
MAKSHEELLLAKLDQLVRLTTIGVTSGLKQREQITLLDRVGFSPKDIADLLGTTGNTVNKELSTLRKAKAKKKPKGTK